MNSPRLHRRLSWALLVTVGLAGMVACGSSGTSPSADDGAKSAATTTPGGALAGSSWNLVSYKGMATTMPAAAAATLAFGVDGSLTGSTGCNQFGGTYSVDGQQLTLTLGPITQRACADPLQQAQEVALIRLFPQVSRFSSTADQLLLVDPGDQTLLTYTAGLSGLENTAWNVTGVNNGRGGVETTALTANLIAGFGPGGVFSGQGGCNNMTGTYQTSGPDGLTITDLATTKKTCGAAVDALEAEYVAALGRVTRYTITGNTATLRASDGATQVTLSLTS